ncbi:regulator of chromosome condensation, putative [Perkinsus marinus ATCC 50983]|uniref:Regulator of chromosome condensation, putative n=1 Tax=Perkinsus marinus (strain ATCC 50983 / TXsc) TaxID=423536 RepID=C5KCF9_PERM5|nr:regulator of chromosome condensation, putative [Perkinsus marinus ATCC 50983]EER17821.1 regulator of chromosome condensation, putative [Perkinsus marinus ATCC 50983]|eukprot:XP_002786025.1 regulator of chromosome condensation, putative [Perkinsus marinus ATCC 50983]
MGSVGPTLERTRRGAQRLSFLPNERWTRVTLGDGFGGAVAENGKAWLWRKGNSNGKNGDVNVVAARGKNSISVCPGLPQSVKFSAIAVSAGHFVGLDQDGGVWCLGSNSRGQCAVDPAIQGVLGVATRVFFGKKGPYVREPRGVSVAVGDYHTMVLDDNGEVWSWGDDTLLQLGHGDTRCAPNNSSPLENMREQKSPSQPLVIYAPFQTHLRFTPTKVADVPTDFDQQHTRELAPHNSGLAPEGIFAGPNTSFLVINDTPYDHTPHDEHHDAVYACGDNEKGQCGRSLQYSQQTFMRVRLPKRIQVQMVQCSSGHCAAWVRRVVVGGGPTPAAGEEGPAMRDWGIYTWGENTAGRVSTTRRQRDVVIPPLDVTRNFPRGRVRWLAVGPYGTAVIVSESSSPRITESVPSTG